MSNSKFMNISRLIAAYNLQIDNEVLPDNLKCVKCKFVLKEACAVPCGCRFCRVCIDDLMASGNEFCPGVSEDCGESILSDSTVDFRANKRVCKLTVKCPQNWCLHECQLDELEEHMRVCGRKSVACPFHELGCQQDKLAAEEMSGHFQQENRSHCEILIGMITNINREMESHKRDNEIFKRELVLKDEQIRIVMDQMEHLENENKSMKDNIKLIELEKADLTDRVRILSDKIEGESDERRENDERDMTNVIEHIDTEITAIRALIGSNKDQFDTAIKSVRDDIRSIHQDGIESKKIDFNCTKSLQEPPVGLGKIDAGCEWLIDGDVAKTHWDSWMTDRTSEYFMGVAQPYKYRLSSYNDIKRGELQIYLRIIPGASDWLLSWPFSGRVAITVAERSKRELCQTITKQCDIERPKDNHYNRSDPFKFSHSSLTGAGLDLSRGVFVSCVIVLFYGDRGRHL